ncbi:MULTISPECIES: Co2+/Mg2+ efflux protein ApaG [Niveibacterium]|uniref:Protein ApaG n=1 Tax=Niveibacterium microcysteis TaxID=2811415 RepID=A0ABX7M2U1_9RHOO|nr:MULTISPECIES: Co2+/Mg2+ efflux protein ApaG [Niveibacterium]QSI76089.1 Co2+/Mg2+ efflux protein ApaG [Niveibacterium microcysteis]
MPEAKSPAITVSAQAQYIEEQSDAEAGRFVFAYKVTIENTGDTPAQLVSRHWVITDAAGHVQEVRGIGVIGEQPRLAPGEAFEYTSGCAIATAVGTMRGAYQMVAEDGTQFEAEIPEFVLAAPGMLH